MFLGKIDWQKWASVAICVGAALLLLFIGGKWIFAVLSPFLLAWVISLLIHPMSVGISSRTHIPRKICSVVMFLGVLTGIVLLVGLSVNRVLTELRRLANQLLSASDRFPEAGETKAEQLLSRFGLFQKLRESNFYLEFEEMISELLSSAMSSLSSKLPQLAGRMISSLPSVLLFVVVTVIAGFYFCIDRKGIEEKIISLLPDRMQKKIPVLQTRGRHFFGRYLRAYLLLLFLTFVELFIGFTVLRVDYAFLLALLIAVVDLLPVLGVGTVLIPWAVVSLLQQNFYLGFGFLILYLTVTVLRQVIEPRLVGQSLGLHPLLTLIAGYAGWKLFGVLGMALGPFFVLIAKSLWAQFHSEKVQE